MSNKMFQAADIAERLYAARYGGSAVNMTSTTFANRQQAYAIQDAVSARLGPIGGWKVGSRTPDGEPICAPCPQYGIKPSGSLLQGSEWQLRGVEVEVGLLLGRDIVPNDEPFTPNALAAAVESVVPIIEVVETRLSAWQESGPLAQLADFQSHGALIVGKPSATAPRLIDLARVEAELRFDDKIVAQTVGGNPAGDIWRLLAWLSEHSAARGHPLRAGQIVTTGSCTGMLFAPAGCRVAGRIAGFGEIFVQF